MGTRWCRSGTLERNDEDLNIRVGKVCEEHPPITRPAPAPRFPALLPSRPLRIPAPPPHVRHASVRECEPVDAAFHIRSADVRGDMLFARISHRELPRRERMGGAWRECNCSCSRVVSTSNSTGITPRPLSSFSLRETPLPFARTGSSRWEGGVHSR